MILPLTIINTFVHIVLALQTALYAVLIIQTVLTIYAKTNISFVCASYKSANLCQVASKLTLQGIIGQGFTGITK